MAVKKQIKESEITCEEIAKNVKQYTNKVISFAAIILSELWGRDTTYQEIKESMQHMIFAEETTSYRGNTKAPAMEYQVYWTFPLVEDENRCPSLWDIENELCERVLLFCYDAREYLDNHEPHRSRFFRIFIAGNRYSEAGTIEKHVIRIASNNDNYGKFSVFNTQVLVRAVMEGRRILKETELIKQYSQKVGCRVEIGIPRDLYKEQCLFSSQTNEWGELLEDVLAEVTSFSDCRIIQWITENADHYAIDQFDSWEYDPLPQNTDYRIERFWVKCITEKASVFIDQDGKLKENKYQVALPGGILAVITLTGSIVLNAQNIPTLDLVCMLKNLKGQS